MTAPFKPKRAPRCSPAYGRCQACTTPLQSWGSRVDGLLVIGYTYGCPMCQAVRVRVHAPVCQCPDCRNGVDAVHKISS